MAKYVLLITACLLLSASCQQVDTRTPCRAFPDLRADLSEFNGAPKYGPFNFTANNFFGPSSIFIDPCGSSPTGALISGTGGPSRLAGDLVSLANNTGAFLGKGVMIFTYRNTNAARRHCGPAGMSLTLEFRCDQTTSQREELSSSEHSFCNIIFTVFTVRACPPQPPVAEQNTSPFVDMWHDKTMCRNYDRGIDLTPLYGISAPAFLKFNTIIGTVYPCGSPRTGSVLDIVSPRHGAVTVASLSNLIEKNVTDNGLSFTFRSTNSPICRNRGQPTVQINFECDAGDEGGDDSVFEGEDPNNDWRIETHEVFAERCFARFSVITALACPKE